MEREPVTVLCSAKGWVRTLKGHQEDVPDVKYKEGDRERFVVCAQTTDKLLEFATNGRFYTLGVEKLPGGRGFGEPLRLMLGLRKEQDIVAVFVYQPGRTPLVASSGAIGRAHDRTPVPNAHLVCS